MKLAFGNGMKRVVAAAKLTKVKVERDAAVQPIKTEQRWLHRDGQQWLRADGATTATAEREWHTEGQQLRGSCSGGKDEEQRLAY
ncbi:hypothetical protein CISIN_1g041593mg [Citrus sinensis]|uniref:Uncharacterized protein n=1 Tax=Citrus sinensis TaxID=2711 RepID=A0A067E8Z3_CITSI|nr:hypothetical protein CISIN_1g041593mg [Citrus sinensis]